MKTKVVRVFALVALSSFFAFNSHAQTTYGLHEKGIERINGSRNVSPLSVDTAFGDQISGYNGGAEFSNVDLSVPGNNALSVEVRRKLTIDDRSRVNGQHIGGFGEWDLDLPKLSSVIATAKGWRPAGGTVNQRCSSPGPFEGTATVAAEDYWDGYQLSIPGQGTQSLLMNPSPSIPNPGNGTSYPWITKAMWRVSCKPSTKNGYAGQAFMATSPEGTKYHLDWVITKNHSSVKGEINSVAVLRQVVHFLVSRVEDRFGNWVDYTYSSDKLTGITSSDARQITLTWSGNKIVSISSSVGSWSYIYTGEKLAQVIQPDNSKWFYVSTGGLGVAAPVWSPEFEDPTGCPDSIEAPSGSYSLAITSPSGATATYAFQVLQHYRTNIPEHACYINSPQYWFMKVPRFDWSLTLVSKVVTGPGLPSMTWNYSYGYPDGFDGNSKQNTVQGPEGVFQRFEYGTGYGLNEGQLLKAEKGAGPTNILWSKTNVYVTSQQAVGQAFPGNVGINPREWSDQLATVQLRPLRVSTIGQQGASFKWEVDNSCGGRLCLDAFARPTRVIKGSSGMSTSASRTDTTEYYDHLGKWVLGQVKRSGNAETNIVTGSADFDPSSGLVVATYGPGTAALQGKLSQALSYYSDGNVATVRDGNNNITTLSNWYRGIPQAVQFADGTSQTAVVNAAGWVTAVTDENGFTTGYGYDTMGRIATVIYPAGDSVGFNNTNRYFRPLTANDWRPAGVAVGQWHSVEWKSTDRKITYYDALWRPVLQNEYDGADTAGTLRATSTAYDASGNVQFQSYPANTVVPPAQGAWSTYDSLNRLISVAQDSEHGLLVSTKQYAAGFQTVTVNPRGQQTVNGYQAYDQPTYDMQRFSVQPEGKVIEMFRHPQLGAVEQLRQRNSDGSLQQSRHYVYNQYRELCKTIEPETGATVMEYDGAGNLGWSVSGLQGFNDMGNCNRTEAWNTGLRVHRNYDTRSRITQQNFPDGLGDQVWTYTPDGLPASITTNNTSGGTQVMNAYSYNKRRLMTGESVHQPGWYTWGLGYGYDANGSLASQTYPTGLAVNYAPNALGQPTEVRDHSGHAYAAGVGYYPNGDIKHFTYGNGLVHSMAQNTRQLPIRSTDSGGAADFAYTYDQNANVTSIWDHARDSGNGLYGRWMTYDGLDRLTDAGSCSFGGDCWHRFAYDALDNMKSWKLPGIKDYANYVYDANNRLTNIQNSAGASVVGLSYDVQGNLSNKNGQNYSFDYGNRLREVTGKEYYRYDGHGRRVLNWRPTGAGALTLSQYSQSGQLMYQQNDNRQLAIEHVYLAGSLLASRERHYSVGTPEIRYQHTDALGSPVATTNAAGTVVDRTSYEPYGASINKTIDGVGYTGHVMDAATGLTYMQQRYYDPGIGLFLSVDPVTAYDSPVVHFHRYRYANNNPYKFVDPDGNKGKVAWLVELGTNQMRKLARLTQEQAVQARGAGQNVVADRRQVASQIETAAHGRDGQLKHAAHELKDGGKGLPHYQTNGVKGHSFWGKLSVGLLAAAAGLDQVAEASDAFDPTVSLTSGSGELANHERTWFGAYRQIDPNGPNFYEADRMRSEGFQGVFRVEGRIDSKRLDEELKGK